MGTRLPARALLAAALLAGAVACSEQRDPAAEPVIRDSAGVAIVHSPHPSWTRETAWHLGLLLTSIGSADASPDEALFRVFDATRLSNGSVAAANAGTSEILLFGADGSFIRRWGGPGGGPGEFRGTYALRALKHVEDDTLLAWDLEAQTVSVFTPDGQFVRSHRLRGASRMYFMRGMYGGGFFADRSMLLTLIDPYRSFSERSAGQLHPATVRLVRFSSQGDSLGMLVELTGGWWYVTSAGPAVMQQEQPFGTRTIVRTSADRVYVAPTGGSAVDVYDESGGLAMRIHVPVEPPRMTDSVRDCWRRNVEKTAAEAPEFVRAPMLRNARDMDLPEVLPIYRTIAVDAESNLWIQRYMACGDPNVPWLVFDSHGMWLGSVSIPARFEVLEIGSDYVLGKSEDELDVESVAVYALLKPKHSNPPPRSARD